MTGAGSVKISKRKQRKITGSEWIDNLGTRAYNRMERVAFRIGDIFPEIEILDIDKQPIKGIRGGSRAFVLIFTLWSEDRTLNNKDIVVRFHKSIDQVSEDLMVSSFVAEFEKYLDSLGMSATV